MASTASSLTTQSRTAWSTRRTRRSSAAKCGSHRIGATGSRARASRRDSLSVFGPLWNLQQLPTAVSDDTEAAISTSSIIKSAGAVWKMDKIDISAVKIYPESYIKRVRSLLKEYSLSISTISSIQALSDILNDLMSVQNTQKTPRPM